MSLDYRTVFSYGSINIWIADPGTKNQGKTLKFDEDDRLLKNVEFAASYSGVIATRNHNSAYLDVLDAYDPVEANLIRIQSSGTWNNVKSFELSGRAEDLGDSSMTSDGQSEKDLEIYNFVHTNIKLSPQSLVGADIMVDGAKRGDINLTNHNDDLVIGISSNGSGWRNSFKVNAREGDDSILFRGAIEDYLFGGVINDTTGQWTSIRVGAGRGNDEVDSSSLSSTDIIRGDRGDDVIRSGGGDDIISGNRGNDALFAGSGNDDLRGGSEDDILVGGAGDDVLRGHKGNDILIGDSHVKVTSNGSNVAADVDFSAQSESLDFSTYASMDAVHAALADAGVTVRARNINKDADRLTNLEEDNVGFDAGGIGASSEAATRPSIDAETGYDPDSGYSELIEFDFDRPITDLEIDLSLFFSSQETADFNQNEVLTYRLYSEGVLVGEHTYVANSSDGSSKETLHITALAAVGGVFDVIQLEALPYNNNTNNADIIDDSSDFLVEGIRFSYQIDGEGDDILRGGNDDDILVGGRGDDDLHGGRGEDIAVFQGAAYQYIFEKDGGSIVITDTVAGRDGQDTVRGVEWFQFNGILYSRDEILDEEFTNESPTAADDIIIDSDENINYTFKEDDAATTISLNVISGVINTVGYEGGQIDTDPEGLALHVVSVNGLALTTTPFQGVYGTLTIDSEGNAIYVRDDSLTQGLKESEVVYDDFSYVISDGELTDTGLLSFTISGVNDAPISVNTNTTAVEDTIKVLTLDDFGLAGRAPADIDVDNDIADLKVLISELPADGALILGGGIVTANQLIALSEIQAGGLMFIGNLDFDGQAFVKYKLKDLEADGFSQEATLTIDITPVNDAPVAQEVTVMVNEDGIASGQLVASNVDNLPEDLIYSLVDAAPAGFTLNQDGSYELDATIDAYQSLIEGEVLDIQLSYTVSDGDLVSTVQTINLKITGQNDAPVAQEATVMVNEDGIASGQLVASDVDNLPEDLVYSLVDAAPAGFTLNQDGSYELDATVDAYQSLFEGEVLDIQVSYTASDGDLVSTAQTINLKITGQNDAPVGEDEIVVAVEDGFVTGQLTATDVDNPAADLTFSIFGDTPAGFTLNPDGSYSFDGRDSAYQFLAPNETLDVFASYTVSDGDLVSTVRTISIEVSGQNDIPTANLNEVLDLSVDEGESAVLQDLKTLFTDIEGDDLEFALVLTSSTLVFNGGLPVVVTQYTPLNVPWLSINTNGELVTNGSQVDADDLPGFAVLAADQSFDLNGTLNSEGSIVTPSPTNFAVQGVSVTVEPVLSNPNIIIGSDTVNDILEGTDETVDVIFGLAGNDSLSGKGQGDFLYGGLGNDTLYGGKNATAIEYGLLAALITGVVTDVGGALIGQGLDSGQDLVGALANVEMPDDYQFGDTISGGAGIDISTYNNGIADYKISYTGAVTEAFVGTSFLGLTSLIGFLTIESALEETDAENDGIDNLVVLREPNPGPNIGEVIITEKADVEILQFSDGTYNLIFDLLETNLSGSAQDDVIVTGPAGQVVVESTGNDYVFGSDGNDTLQLINNFEDYTFNFTNDDPNLGSGTILNKLSNDIITFESIEFISAADTSTLSLTEVADLIEQLANTPNVIIGSDTVNDILEGTDETIDVIFGLAGNDSLSGKGRGDFLYGGLGNDTLYGGKNATAIEYGLLAALITGVVTNVGGALTGQGLDSGHFLASALANVEMPDGYQFGDTISGGAGIDTSTYDNSVADYKISYTGAVTEASVEISIFGSTTLIGFLAIESALEATDTDNDGIDNLVVLREPGVASTIGEEAFTEKADVEILQFSDGTYNLIFDLLAGDTNASPLDGTNGQDIIVTGPEGHYVNALGGDDRVYLADGVFDLDGGLLDGGEGLDILLIDDAYGSYTISNNAGQLFIQKDSAGYVNISNIEEVHYEDAIVTINGTASYDVLQSGSSVNLAIANEQPNNELALLS